MHPPSDPLLRHAVDAFWETFPPFWHLVRAHIRRVAVEQFGISVEQFHILRQVRRGLVSISALAAARNISRPAISQAVEVLVQKGLLTRATDPRDRRYIQLSLTTPGNALLDAIFDNTRQWMVQTLATLSEEELEALILSLNALRKTQSA
jgi:DNA-binding MarR family transcriptional regulator